MRSQTVIFAAAAAVVLWGSAVGAQQNTTLRSVAVPAPAASPQVAPLQLSANDRMSMDLARANQQIADLRQQLTAVQQELRQLRTAYDRHTHAIQGSVAPIEDVVRRPEGYRNFRTWVGQGMPTTGGPRQ
jgi:hypothetical protein